MKISECRDKLKVGLRVRTNGGLHGVGKPWITGEIGEICEGRFFVWQNEYNGGVGLVEPSTKGYSGSWCIYFDDCADIEILQEGDMVLNLEGALKAVDESNNIGGAFKEDVKNILRILCSTLKKTEEKFYLGDIVKAIGCIDGVDLKDKVGKVIWLRHFDRRLGVEFKESFRDGGACGGHGKSGHCGYGKPGDFELVYRSPQ